MSAYIFPGQGAQHPGMGEALYNAQPAAKVLFEQANDLLGFRITDLMFSGTKEALQQTRITQPAIFLHSVALMRASAVSPRAVAGHSLGEFSALVAAKVLSFRDGFRLVSRRAALMQEACEITPSTMVAVLGAPEKTVEQACKDAQKASGRTVVLANHNTSEQLVISGDVEGVDTATSLLRRRSDCRLLPLPVGGAFHSPLMETAKERLAETIASIRFSEPICPVYQNYSALPTTDAHTIQKNLVAQLTAPVLWRQSVEQMVKDGHTNFVECGPKRTLTGLVKKIAPHVHTSSL